MKKILMKKVGGLQHSIASDRKAKDVQGLVLEGSCLWSPKLHSLSKFTVSFGCTNWAADIGCDQSIWYPCQQAQELSLKMLFNPSQCH